ncbi:hypothetical protein [Mangrovibacterium diazotrophicum]|uniref:Uncharacterized protein n=1 Tax=Mangrovibacterium diazotrophicum TaxID=1261403 RepID=A0A419WBM5_9BACT|nr:hypothetical protein [Mangrovibacterium diazotrophicum]RKD92863.1 hypothetical protein BC643_3240 [Mangrovibacterium diazotrophicum]
MNRLVGILLIMVSTLLFFACQKEDQDDQPSLDLENSVSLRINNYYNSYVAENDDHFYYGTLNPGELHLFRLHIQRGMTYQVASTQPGVNSSVIAMTLLDSEQDTIAESYRSGSYSNLSFTAENDSSLYVAVYLKASFSETIDYRLYFESLTPRTMQIADNEWEYIGDWQATGPKALTYTNCDIRQFRWLRLQTNGEEQLKVSFTLKLPERLILPSIGFICDGSYDRARLYDYKEILPLIGTFFNIENNEDYKVYSLSENSSNPYIHGTFDIPIDAKNGVKLTMNYEKIENEDYCSVYINDSLVSTSTTGPLWYVYLVMEDWDYDTFVIEDLSVEKN